MKKWIAVMVVVVLVLSIGCAAAVGYLWYRNAHVFVGEDVYRRDLKELDLRGQDVSFDYYRSVRTGLPLCNILWDVPFQGDKVDCTAQSLTLQELTEDDITVMQVYLPRLETVYADGFDDYAMLDLLKEKMPFLTVEYTVSIGATRVAPDTRELELKTGDYDLDTLKANLPRLTQLERIVFRKPELSREEIAGLQEQYPNLDIRCTVQLMGQEVDPHISQLDLSAVTPEQLPDLLEELTWLEGLQFIELQAEDGSYQLSKEDVKSLMDAVPGTAVHYSFEFFGQTLVTNETAEIHIKNKNIGDKGIPEVHQALELLQNCSKFTAEYCRISDEAMARLREDFRGKTKVVWRVSFGGGTTMTDAEVIRCTYDLRDSNSGNLKYCEDVRYVDIGHNELIRSVDFVAGMKSLEIIIISGSMVADLTPFAQCKNLRVLEAAFCEYLEDVSPLAACENLTMLNISYSHVTDLSPLDGLKLETLSSMYYPDSRVPQEERDRFREVHPDCLAQFTGKQPYGFGWRYDESNEPLPWYAEIKEAFRYPEPPNNAGWYLSGK